MSHATANLLNRLSRPKLLVRAARHGLDTYDRTRDLPRVMHAPYPPDPQIAVTQLIEEEATLETHRKTGAAAYSVARHVDVLIALMAEARLLSRPAHGL